MVALAWYESQSLGGLATTAFLILSAIVIIASKYFQCKSTHQEYLAGLPWVGMRKQIFPELRAGARFITSSRDVLASGYAKVSIRLGLVSARLTIDSSIVKWEPFLRCHSWAPSLN